MAYQFKIRFFKQVNNIFFASCEKIVQAQNVMPLCDQTITQMGAQETCSARYEYTFLVVDHVLFLLTGLTGSSIIVTTQPKHLQPDYVSSHQLLKMRQRGLADWKNIKSDFK